MGRIFKMLQFPSHTLIMYTTPIMSEKNPPYQEPASSLQWDCGEKWFVGLAREQDKVETAAQLCLDGLHLVPLSC